ncbi:MAG: hypothetical protein JWQ63_3447 [Mucilaginibacter sp.]|nr:hypothetical protein [Mucilaginibacter sp.]
MKTLLAIQLIHVAMHIAQHMQTIFHSLGHLMK